MPTSVKLLCAVLICTGVVCAQARQLTEAEAVAAVKLATNPTTKLAAAEEFVKTFPNSNSRREVARVVADAILDVRNGAVAVTLLERAHAIFTKDEERELLKPAALSTYVLAERTNDAFKSAAEILAQHPEDVDTLVMMVHVGAAQVRKRKPEHADVATQYALTAIAMIEAGKKPAKMDQQAWADNTAKLASLYQDTAILYLGANKSDQAKIFLTKAIEREPHDPTNYALLGRVIHADYEKLRDRYGSMSDPYGTEQRELLKKINALVDQMVDAYARTVALATGRPEYQLLIQQVMHDLTEYYRYRNNQSTAGLQQLIDKYKRQP